jgi:hypothetical protein
MLLVAVPSDRDPGFDPSTLLVEFKQTNWQRDIFVPEHFSLSVNYHSVPSDHFYNPENGVVTLIGHI